MMLALQSLQALSLESAEQQDLSVQATKPYVQCAEQEATKPCVQSAEQELHVARDYVGN